MAACSAIMGQGPIDEDGFLFKKSNFDGAEKTIKKEYRFLPFKFIANVIVHLPELTCLMNTVVFNLFFQSSS